MSEPETPVDDELKFDDATLRDYFAVEALKLVDLQKLNPNWPGWNHDYAQAVASMVYAFADAMLEARKR